MRVGPIGLIALKEHNPSIKDVSFDIDGMTIAKANTKVEDTVIKTIVIGYAYLEKGKKDNCVRSYVRPESIRASTAARVHRRAYYAVNNSARMPSDHHPIFKVW